MHVKRRSVQEVKKQETKNKEKREANKFKN